MCGIINGRRPVSSGANIAERLGEISVNSYSIKNHIRRSSMVTEHARMSETRLKTDLENVL